MGTARQVAAVLFERTPSRTGVRELLVRPATVADATGYSESQIVKRFWCDPILNRFVGRDEDRARSAIVKIPIRELVYPHVFRVVQSLNFVGRS